MKLSEKEFETIEKHISKGGTCFMRIKTRALFLPSTKASVSSRTLVDTLLALNYREGYFIYLAGEYRAVHRLLPTDYHGKRLIRYFFREFDEIVEFYKNIEEFERVLVLEDYLGYIDDEWYKDYLRRLTK